MSDFTPPRLGDSPMVDGKVFDPWTDPYPSAEQAGCVNQYTCQVCGKGILTINDDAGTTTFAIGCKATKGCPGEMFSSFYRVNVCGENVRIDWHWHRPPREEVERLDQGFDWSWARRRAEHIRWGGLELVKLPAVKP